MRRLLLLLTLLLAPIFLHAQEDNQEESYPDTVKIGAYIISVHDINFHEKQYTMRMWLWLLYDNLEFDFAKQIDIPNAKQIDEPEVIMDMVDGKMWQLMKMKIFHLINNAWWYTLKIPFTITVASCLSPIPSAAPSTVNSPWMDGT
jgi:hypothetical protein